MSHQSRHADTDGILRTTHDTVAALRIVLETEHQLGKNLRIHVRQLHRPYLLDHVAGRSGKTAALTHLESWEERHGDSPARSMAAYVWLVYPGTCQVETGRKLTGRILDIRARTGGETICRSALQHHILDAPLLAELAFGFAAAVRIHHKDIGLHDVDGRNKVHNAIASIDIGILYIFNRLHHKETLLLGIKRLMMLVAENRLVGSDTYVEVAVLRRLAEKLNVAAMQQVIATTYKNFLHIFKLLFLFRTNYQIKDRFAVFVCKTTINIQN